MASVRSGFDDELAGRRAECDGGHAVPGTHLVARQEFAGTLTGDYVDHGDPPWRWYLLGELTRTPEGYADRTVWCESGNLFVVDSVPGPGGNTPPDTTSKENG